MLGLSIRSIHKSFGPINALSAVSFDIEQGEVVALLGPSGCGKSTLLSLIAGLDTLDSGSIYWNGASLQSIPPHKRGFGLMFQDYALFPHLNVQANVAFGLKIAGLPLGEIKQRTEEVLELVGLPAYGPRDVNTLSGGEQQRVALARALAPHPRLLMLDEPLGSLDRNLRERLVSDLNHILRGMHQTAIYVTHDLEEAFSVADRIVLMNHGRVEQIGTPQEIYATPASQFVARFLELTNLFEAEVIQQSETSILLTPVGEFVLKKICQTGRVEALIRPDYAVLGDVGPCVLHGVVNERSFRGSWQRISVKINQIDLIFDFPSSHELPISGDQIIISFNPTQAILIFQLPN